MRRLLFAALLLAPSTALGFSFGNTIGSGDPWTAANAAQIQTFLNAIDDCPVGSAVTGAGTNVTPSNCIDFLTAAEGDALFLTPAEGDAAYRPLGGTISAADITTATITNQTISLGGTTSIVAGAGTAIGAIGGTITANAFSGTLPIANGGTNATTEAAARTSLGLAIGTNVQAWDADLDDLSDGTLTFSKVGGGTINRCVRFDASGNLAAHTEDCGSGGGTDDQTAAEVPFTPNGSIAATNTQAAVQEVRDEAQPLDSNLTAIAALTTTPHGRGLLDDANAAASRASIEAVGLTGNETIAGTKTFSGDVVVQRTGSLTVECDTTLDDCSEIKPIEPTSAPNPTAGNVAVRYAANAIILRDTAGAETTLGSGGSSAFSAITAGTNTAAAMVVGTGASLATSGSGTIAATSAPLSGVSGLGTGVETFLGTPSSANLAAAVTDETGTGAVVFASSPVLVTPNLGTPSAVNLTNATNVPADDLVGTVDVANGGTGAAPGVGGDQVLVSTSATAATWRTLPSCSDGVADKLLYNSATDAFTCGADQGGGGGMTSFNAAGTSGTAQEITNGNTLTIAAGAGITTTAAAIDTVTVAVDSTVARAIASSTATLGTAAITSGACATTVTVAAADVAATDTITWTPNADISAVTGYAPVTTGGLSIYSFPTAGNVNFKVCNPTSASITPGAVTLNWRVIR